MGSEKRRVMFFFLVALLFVSACAGGGSSDAGAPSSDDVGQGSSPATLEGLALYDGEDWDDVMQEGAAEEGEVSVYTAIPPETIEPLLDAFSSAYDVGVELYSATGEEIRNRIIQEQTADRFTVDVILGADVLHHLILGAENALQPFATPSGADYDESHYDPEHTWYSIYENYFVAAYNTDLVDAASVPTTYEEALDPQWAGMLGIEASDVGWFATLVDHWGEPEETNYFGELAAHEPFVVSGHTTLTNLVIAGEVPVALTIYNYRAELEKEAGAPIEWVPLEPAVAIYNGVAIPRQAPHPHAALAMAEFLLSEEGQVQLAELTGQIPSHPDVPADPPSLKEGFEAVSTAYELLLDDYDGWAQRWEETMIRGNPTLGE